MKGTGDGGSCCLGEGKKKEKGENDSQKRKKN